MIRQGRPQDANAIRELVLDAYSHYVARMGKPPGPMLDDYNRRVADKQAWVLEANGQLAGVLVLEDAGDGALLLDNVAVAPSAQNRGCGRALSGDTVNPSGSDIRNPSTLRSRGEANWLTK